MVKLQLIVHLKFYIYLEKYSVLIQGVMNTNGFLLNRNADVLLNSIETVCMYILIQWNTEKYFCKSKKSF